MNIRDALAYQTSKSEFDRPVRSIDLRVPQGREGYQMERVLRAWLKDQITEALKPADGPPYPHVRRAKKPNT